MKLTALDDDMLISILSFLEPSQIRLARMACKRLYALTQTRIVWTNACLHYILEQNYPFPNTSLDTLSVRDLERYVCHSARLATKWLSGNSTPQRVWSTTATANTSVVDVRLVPGSQGTLLLTLSKSVWSAITIWQLDPVTSPVSGGPCSFLRRCEWSPRGAIFNGFSLNSNPASEVKLVISVINGKEQTVEFLSLDMPINGGDWSLQSVMSFPTTFKPILLDGDILAMSDERGETIIFNCKTRKYATLEQPQESQSILQHDKCMDVVFTPRCILVVRARSLSLFPFPTLKGSDEEPSRYSPIAQHSFGWVDGVSVQMTGKHRELSTVSSASSNLPLQPLSILLRAETDDPWSSDTLTMELYTLHPNLDDAPSPDDFQILGQDDVVPVTIPSSPSSAMPYLFPPILSSKVSSRRGALRCTDIILGRFGTALWIQPRDRSAAGLFWTADDAPPGPQTDLLSGDKHESLVATVFPGPLFPKKDECKGSEETTLEGRVIYWNEHNNWSCIDYDEDVGRIVLGTSFGKITVLDM